MTLAIATVGMVLLLWAAILAVFVLALALATRHRMSRAHELRAAEPAPERRREGTSDRRRGGPDRRVGMPDLRSQRVDRRSTGGDRRRGLPDRRGMLGGA